MTTLRLRSPHRCRPPALAAAATLAALSGPAHAQSTLTLYGVADAGVQYLSRADGRHAAWRLQNYGILPSQLGIKGEEDLGGGWRARFQLEQGINLNDSTATVPGYAFFRGAYVGMGGPAGTVTLGRQFSTLFDKTLFYDPLWYASYSGQGVLVPLSANFVDHSIKFQSATFAGFDVEALAAMAGIAVTRAPAACSSWAASSRAAACRRAPCCIARTARRKAAPIAPRSGATSARSPRVTRSPRCRSPSTPASSA